MIPAPPMDFGELPHTLEHGWVNVKGRGDVFDPRLAHLVLKLYAADLAVLRDVTEHL